MKKSTLIRNCLLATALLGSSLLLQAQTATWNGLGGDGLWNTAANWNNAIVPGQATNAVINSAVTVNYSAPMSASSISNLYLGGNSVLNIAAAGFNVDSGVTANSATIGVTGSGATLNVNSGGSLTFSNAGSVYVSTNGIVNVNTGGTLLITNPLTTDSVTLGDNKRLASATSRAQLKILGGTATINNRVSIAGSTSGGGAGNGSEIFVDSGTLNLLGGARINNTTDDGGCRVLVNGGSVYLGNFSVSKSTANPGAGLVISNGVVTASTIQIGTGNSQAHGSIYGGVLTNTGTFTISDTTTAANSGTRRSRFFVLGGTVVSTGPAGIIVGNQANALAGASSVFGGLLDVSGGTVTANGITLVKDNTIANAYGTFNLSGTGTVYLGSIGLVGNTGAGGSGYFVNISGGTLGANADFTNNANVNFTGSPIIKTADAAGTPYNIYASGVWSGGGALTKIGNGILTLNAADTYTGNTAINAGKLVLGASGSINNSPVISVASGATFDVSAVSGYTVPASKTIAGFGVVTGDVSFASTAMLKPGSNALTGTLSFSNNVTQSGGVVNQFDLSTNPSGPNNDRVVIGGDFNVSGVSNIVDIAGGGPANSIHPLFNYYGNFTGDLSSFALTGTAGWLTNITTTTPKSIAFVVAVTIRGATNVVWLGNDANNVWDVLNTTNWLNAAALDYFVTGDNVLFNSVGQMNSNVLINVTVSPASTTVDSAGDYSFSGTGAIGGLGGLTKTNTGTLTISTDNSYSGVTTISGGKVSVATLANGGLPSTIGAATAASGNLIFNGGALEYTGVNKTIDRGATLQSSGGTLSVTDPTATLTVSGLLTGAGTLTKIGNGQLTLSTANNYSGGTVITSGTIRAGQGSSITLTALGTNTVTMNGGETNAANFLFGADAQVLFNTLSVIGTNNFVTIAGNDTLENIVGNGTLYLNAISGTTLSIEGNMSTFSGTLYAGTVPNLRMHPSTGSANAVFNLGTGSCLFNNRNGNLTVQVGALIGGPSTTIQGASSANNPTTYVIGALNQPTLFEGNITEVTSARKVNLVKVGTSSLTLSGASLSYTGNTTVSNGVLALSGSSTLPNSAVVTVGAGAFLDVSALGTPTFTVNTTQTLKGDGTVNGSVDGTGTISPGNAIGTLHVTNVATLGGTLYVELNRTNGAQTNDILAANSIVLGGTLTVTNLGPNLVAGDRFYLFNGPISGSFATVNLPGNLGNVTYTWTDNTAVDGSIQVATVTTVNQTPTNLVTSVSGNTLTLSWPSDHIGWRLQSQTNSLSSGLSGTWTDVSGAETTNSVNITLDPANGAVFYRMVYP